MQKTRLHIPLSEKLKNIPGLLGIQLNEKPKYRVLKHSGPFEIRKYSPMMIAKTSANGPYESARKECFLKLAGYIFGQNEGGKTLPMTSPVMQEYRSITEDESLTMSFVLPQKQTLATAPIPLDENIHLEKIPAQIWAVLQYPGTNKAKRITLKTKRLIAWIRSAGRTADLNHQRVAQYDSPNTIPFLRRNEVQILIDEPIKH